jgi:Ti-type conjugative transfer relaxase TraA
MAIYHLSAKVISRANGSSALAAAAYRSASRLHDQRLDRHHDFSNKAGVVHSEVMLPDGAPEDWRDREQLWNAAEAAEKRIDAQLSREIEFAIPREMRVEEGVALARDFVQREFVDRGMIADLNVHWDIGADGLAKPHAHVMLTTREVGEDGFGAKVRDWNRTDLLNHWREAWADHVNERLAELDIDARVDHRSLEAQGIDLEPQNKLGPAAARMAEQGLSSERLVEHQAIARANGDKILANPGIALDTITHSQATFTTRDLAMFVHRHSDGKEQFDQVMTAVRRSPELVRLGQDGRGQERFTSRTMLQTEQRLERATTIMAERDGHATLRGRLELAQSLAKRRGLELGWEQQIALHHVTQPGDLKTMIGYAGTGKSALLGVAREAWEDNGYRVHGLALSGIAAENLEHGSGIASRTIASIEHQWAQGRDLLTSNDVLVIDEAGMIGTRQMERVVREVEKRGAKLVLVGDPEQLQAIEAGAAFRSIAERHGAVEITQVRRQGEEWQRDATRHLATGRTGEALDAYAEHGFVKPAVTRDAAREKLVARWDAGRISKPHLSRLILAHTRDEVRSLNELARERLHRSGLIGPEQLVQTENGERSFGCGDKVMFLRNDRGLGVKNGSLGVVQSVTSTRMAVMLDDGRSIAFDTKDYAHIDHGYAATIHKAQGVTVDRVHVLATPGLDRHAAYVALTRHREHVALYYGEDDFADRGKLVRTLSRERAKDMASDYARDFADHREIRVPPELADRAPARSIFAGLKLTPGPIPPARPERSPLDQAIARHARAVQAIFVLNDQGRNLTPEAVVEFTKAGSELDRLRPHAAVDAENAYSHDPSLAREAARGDTQRARLAIDRERELRTSPERRAERFIERWAKLSDAAERAYVDGDYDRRRALQDDMRGMAKSLERDPQLESILAIRKRQLGIMFDTGRELGAELAFHHGFDLTRGRGLGIGI